MGREDVISALREMVGLLRTGLEVGTKGRRRKRDGVVGNAQQQQLLLAPGIFSTATAWRRPTSAPASREKMQPPILLSLPEKESPRPLSRARLLLST